MLSPRTDHLLIDPEVIKEEEITQSGLIVKKDKDTMREVKSRVNKGTVLNFGPEVKDQRLRKIGTTVLYYPYGVNEVMIGDKIKVIIREEDCMGVDDVPEIKPEG